MKALDGNFELFSQELVRENAEKEREMRRLASNLANAKSKIFAVQSQHADLTAASERYGGEVERIVNEAFGKQIERERENLKEKEDARRDI